MASFSLSDVNDPYKNDRNSGLSNYYSQFDAQGYMNANPDVKKAILQGQTFGAKANTSKSSTGVRQGGYWIGGANNILLFDPMQAAAASHYQQYGMNEGRAGGGSNFGGIYNPISINNSSGSSNSSGLSGSSNSGNSTTTDSNSLLGTGGYLGTGVNFDNYVEKMKGLTDWKLGVDKRSMENAYGFRDKEATRDYGFQTGLAGQQIQGQKDITGQQIEGTKNLETLRNEYMNKRQSEQLANQRTMQEAGFGQQSKLLSDNAARAKGLYFGGR